MWESRSLLRTLAIIAIVALSWLRGRGVPRAAVKLEIIDDDDEGIVEPTPLTLPLLLWLASDGGSSPMLATSLRASS